MDQGNVTDIISKPEVFSLLPRRSVEDRLFCIFWDDAWRGVFSWSVYKDGNGYVLRRLRTVPAAGAFKLGFDVYGSDKKIADEFTQSIYQALSGIPIQKSGRPCIDSNHLVVSLGSEQIVDIQDFSCPGNETADLILTFVEGLDRLFGHDSAMEDILRSPSERRIDHG